MSEEKKKPQPTIVMVDGRETIGIETPRDRVFRSAWKIFNDVIGIDPVKAADVVHATRRIWREWNERQPFIFCGIEFDCDPKSVERFSNVLKATEYIEKDTAGKFQVDWYSTSGTPLTLDYAGICQMQKALVGHQQAVFTKNQERKKEINKAKDDGNIEELWRLEKSMRADVGYDHPAAV